MVFVLIWLLVFGGAFAMVGVFCWGLVVDLVRCLLGSPPPPNTIVFGKPKRG
jgi:hypothetical protein